MRKRLFPAGAALTLALGLLTAAPASAIYQDPSITFPNGTSEFYSPFSGPATVTFSFDPTSSDATFELRLRPQGGATIRKKTVFIDPDTQTSPRVVQFSWPALSVGSARTYQVAVYRSGTLQGSPESFLLRPPLVSITGATPNPFFPWIDDDIKDETTISYRLRAASDPTIVRIFAANANGRCCGSLVFEQDDAAHPSGTNQYQWNGRTQESGGSLLPKGDYFVKIRAEDAANLVGTSKPFKVSIARTYRATATKTKAGTSYHHTTESALVRGGDCFVHAQGGYLQVDCHGAKMSVYYRWGLGSAQRIEKASFVIDNANSECGTNRRKPGHTTHESFLTVTDAVSGITSCRIVTAKITYSFPKAS